MISMKKKYYWIIGIAILILAVFLIAGYMLWPKAEIIQHENLTIEELKSTVYQAIRKYVPQSTIGDFEYVDRMSTEHPFDSWHYPSRNEDLSKNVIQAHIYDYHYDMGDPDTLESLLSKRVNVKEDEVYIKELENGKVLISDTKNDYFSRYEYLMTFNCQNKYQIIFQTIDFYGNNPWPIYENYTIDRIAMENMANEILSKCK